MEITIVTKNKYKIASMRALLEPQGIDLVVKDFYVPEIQADSCEEVASFSARFAANHCNQPVIKADAGLFISALGGLPGAYTSSFQKKLGPAKLLKLLEGESDRSAKIVYALAYCEPGGKPKVFVSGSEGMISKTPKGKEGMLIDFLFIPRGSKQTLGELRESDPKRRELAWGDSESRFVKWFLRRKRVA